MKLSYLAAILIATLAAPTFANDPDWNGDPEPPVEPPAPPPPSIVTGSDRDDPLPVSRRLPCCIADGQLYPMWEPFATDAGTLRRCEQWLRAGDALIYECPGAVSPEAAK